MPRRDPSFDIDGIDAAHKLTILLALGFTGHFDLSALHIEGIQHVTLADIGFAKELGYKIKHLGIIQNTADGVEARVHPALVSMNALLANVNDVMNAVQINSDGAGETLFSGPGAGGEATASAVLSDALASGPTNDHGQWFGPWRLRVADADPAESVNIVPIAKVVSANYLRIPTLDQPGVFAQVTQALSEFSISIDAAIQHEASGGQQPVDNRVDDQRGCRGNHERGSGQTPRTGFGGVQTSCACGWPPGLSMNVGVSIAY